MHAPVVVGAGELLWDCFPDQRRPGGAPSNVAFHANQLGMQGVIWSRIGVDRDGDALLQFLQQNNLEKKYVQRDPNHETGRVTVRWAQDGEPEYTIHQPAAWDFLDFGASEAALAGQTAAVSFGTLAQRHPKSREALHAFLKACSDHCLVVYDVNLRPPFFDRDSINASLRVADVVKLNGGEVEVIADLFQIPGNDLVPRAEGLRKIHGNESVCVTLGNEGCLFVTSEGNHREAGIAVDRADPVGAGDAFTAAVIYARLHQWKPAQTAQFCNQVAAMVVGQRGAMPSLAGEFGRLIQRFA